MKDIRIIIIAPTPALRAGLGALLHASQFDVIAALATPGTALPEADLIVLGDVALLDDLLNVLNKSPYPGLLVLADDNQALPALRDMAPAGWGLLSHDTAPDQLQAAVRAIAQGLIVLTPMFADPVARAQHTLFAPTAEQLSTRELEVLGFLSQGLTNKQIALRLSISDHTVKFHISAIIAKLGASSRTDAVGKAMRQGLISL